MISYRTGNLLDAPGIPVIPVNCVGVMGKGLALQAAKKWPWVEAAYRETCYSVASPSNFLVPGWFIFESAGKQTIGLLATKQHWRDPSRLTWVEQGLKNLAISSWPAAVFNLPKLGCGLGGLDWADVKPLMVKYLKDAPGTFNIYE